MSSRVPSASPLTGREAAQNASCAMVTPPDSRPLAGAARLGPEDLQIMVQLDRLAALGNDPRMPGGHGTAVEHHDLRRPQGHPDFPAVEPAGTGYFTIRPVYVCDPDSPRLASAMRLETRTNDLLRVCSPGRTDLSIPTIDHLGAVEDELNNRLSPSSLTAHQPSCSKRF